MNGTTARYVEMNDVYHWPGSAGGHPSDVLMPIFAAAEHARANGRDFLTAVVLGYEIYLRMSDAVKTPGFDCANFCVWARRSVPENCWASMPMAWPNVCRWPWYQTTR